MSKLFIFKREKTFKLLLTTIGITTMIALLSVSSAEADPRKTIDETVQKTQEVTNSAKNIGQLPTEVKSLEKTDETLNMEHAVPKAIITQVPSAGDTVDTQDTNTPAIKALVVTTPTVGTSVTEDQKCYAQSDGTTECICENETECEALKSSDTCKPGSEWGKDNGFGGCTKKED